MNPDELNVATSTNIAVIGLWHLGSVTAACLAQAGHTVIGLDDNAGTIEALQRGQPPVSEPGLAELTAAGLASGHLTFSTNSTAISKSEIVWIAFDTPVDDDDNADVGFVLQHVIRLFPFLKDDVLVLISSQIPVGSTQKLEAAYRAAHPNGGARFAYSPENLRLGKAISVFTHPDRIVVGVRSERDKELLASTLAPFTQTFVWMSVEAAEVTKHAINAFLAISVTFINELASICERVGANALEVEAGLKSEARIGPGAYLHPGGAFAGGTLARDVAYLVEIGKREGLPTELFESVRTSNDAHRKWPERKITEVLGANLTGRRIAVLGLTYKPSTSTLRRSMAVELCRWLHERGAVVSAYDPSAETLPAELGFVQRSDDLRGALKSADAAVIGTACEEFKSLTESDMIETMPHPIVIDAGGYLERTLSNCDRIRYFSVGRTHGTLDTNR